MLNMGILKEERGQGGAELLLIFGGIIVIAIAAGIYYKNYLNGTGQSISNTDVQNINKSLDNLTNKFNST